MDKSSSLTRRTFILGMLTTGYALAASPVADNIVRTDTVGLAAGRICADDVIRHRGSR